MPAAFLRTRPARLAVVSSRSPPSWHDADDVISMPLRELEAEMSRGILVEHVDLDGVQDLGFANVFAISPAVEQV